MNQLSRAILYLLLVASLSIASGFPQAQSSPAPVPPTANSAPTSGVHAEFLNELKIQEDKFVQLAQAIPADKYT